MWPTSLPHSSSTPDLERLLIFLIAHLESAPFSSPNVFIAFNIVPLFLPKSSYGVPLIFNVDPPVVRTFAYSASHTPSVVPLSTQVSKYGISILVAQPNYMLPLQVGSQ